MTVQLAVAASALATMVKLFSTVASAGLDLFVGSEACQLVRALCLGEVAALPAILHLLRTVHLRIARTARVRSCSISSCAKHYAYRYLHAHINA